MEGHTEMRGLIRESQSGNKQATERLYTMFLPLLKKYAQKIGNEDALSDLTLNFLQMLKKMPIQDSDLASCVYRQHRANCTDLESHSAAH